MRSGGSQQGEVIAWRRPMCPDRLASLALTTAGRTATWSPAARTYGNQLSCAKKSRTPHWWRAAMAGGVSRSSVAKRRRCTSHGALCDWESRPRWTRHTRRRLQVLRVQMPGPYRTFCPVT